MCIFLYKYMQIYTDKTSLQLIRRLRGNLLKPQCHPGVLRLFLKTPYIHWGFKGFKKIRKTLGQNERADHILSSPWLAGGGMLSNVGTRSFARSHARSHTRTKRIRFPGHGGYAFSLQPPTYINHRNIIYTYNITMYTNNLHP